jgi:hypothetical protein
MPASESEKQNVQTSGARPIPLFRPDMPSAFMLIGPRTVCEFCNLLPQLISDAKPSADWSYPHVHFAMPTGAPLRRAKFSGICMRAALKVRENQTFLATWPCKTGRIHLRY